MLIVVSELVRGLKLETLIKKFSSRSQGGFFLVRDNLVELIAISEREILSQIGEVIQVIVVGNKFLGGVASLK